MPTPAPDLSLTGAASYSHAATNNSQVRQLQAVGNGSLLDLGGLTSITNGTDYGSQIQIAAMAGAIIDLSGVTQIADGNGGDYRVRAVTVTATSAGSTVKLNALTTFTDGQAGDTSLSGDAAFSRLNAYGGGTLQTPALTTLDGVYIDEDTANSINTAQITSLKDGQVDFTGAVIYDLSNVTDLTHTTVNVGGANRTIGFPRAATIDGASFNVSGGAHLALPVAKTYNHAATNNSETRHFSAAGAGSLLDLTALTAITNGTNYGSQILVNAQAGATIDLSGVTQIADGTGGDTRVRAITMTATGAGSNVKLNALTTFTDSNSGDTSLSGDAAFSRLDAYAGGILLTPALTTLDGVYLDEDTANAITTSQITSLKDGQVDFTGGAGYDLSNVTDLTHTTVNVSGAGRVVVIPKATTIDGASFYVTAGAHLSLPLATNYNQAPTNNSEVRHFEAAGAGSLLDLSALTSITNGTSYGSQVQVDALGGAVVDLKSVTQIADGNGGDTRVRAVTLTATGSGSTINLNALTTFTDSYGGDTSLSGDAAFSRLNAYAGGTLQTPALTTLDNVYIDEDTANAINTSQITSLKDGQVDFNGTVTYDLTNVTDLTHTTITVAGSNRVIAFPNAKTIDGASFFVSGGAHLALPAATAYAHAATNNNQVRHFQATGVGSLLDLSALTSITNGTSYGSQIQIDAIAGATIDLGSVKQIADGAGGDYRLRAVTITASGANSTVKLARLRRSPTAMRATSTYPTTRPSRDWARMAAAPCRPPR